MLIAFPTCRLWWGDMCCRTIADFYCLIFLRMLTRFTKRPKFEKLTPGEVVLVVAGSLIYVLAVIWTAVHLGNPTLPLLGSAALVLAVYRALCESYYVRRVLLATYVVVSGIALMSVSDGSRREDALGSAVVLVAVALIQHAANACANPGRR